MARREARADNDHLIETPIGPQLFSATRVTLSIILGGGLIVLLIAVPLGLTAGARSRLRGPTA